MYKRQGLEYDSVKIIITNETEERITHNIFYTAITRAKEKLKIYHVLTDRNIGGAGRWLLNYLKYCDRKTYDVRVVDVYKRQGVGSSFWQPQAKQNSASTHKIRRFITYLLIWFFYQSMKGTKCL